MKNLLDKLLNKYDNKNIRSLVQLVPLGIGAAIDIYLKETINQIRYKRLKIFYDELADGKIELTGDIIQNEDFLYCYFLTIKTVLNTRRREKIKYLSSLFSKTTRPGTYRDIDEFEKYFKILDDMSLQELEILTLLYNLEINNPIKCDRIVFRLQENNKFWKEFKITLMNKYNIDEKDIDGILIRIERTGCFLYSRVTANELYQISGMTTNIFKKLVKLISK